ncbi:MAG TPA: hypothetical protein VMB49_10800 [Acidobacteriaceae bacterium]|nr:hypothetical protein [Acidobacteriaceae bacterium]
MKIGIWIYALATVVTGILNIVWGALEPTHQPIQSLGKHVPGAQILAYIAGAWLIAAGLAFLWRRTERMGAAASAIIYLVFALLWLPRFWTATHVLGFRLGVVVFILFGIGQQLLLMSPAVIVYALRTSLNKTRALTAARWLLGLGPVVFGLGHLIGWKVMAGFVPHWVPFPVFWAILTGIVFLLSGISILSGIYDVLAVRLLALMLFLFEVIVEAPPVFAQPHSQTAWGGAVYNITAIGACLIFSEFVMSRRNARHEKTGVTTNIASAQPDSLIA